MKLTDPTALLAQVNAERYSTLLNSCRNSRSRSRKSQSPKKENLSKSSNGTLSYVEPYLSPRPVAAASNGQPAKGQGVGETAGGEFAVIKSQVYSLGDFVDTDAVSKTPMIDSVRKARSR